MSDSPEWPLGTGRALRPGQRAEPLAALTQGVLDGLPPINNDHVVDAGRRLIYLSANDGHIWAAPLAGGAPTRVTNDPSRYHFLHGVSPDGTTSPSSTCGAATSPQPAASRSSRRRAERRRIPRRGGWFPHASPDAEFAAYVSFPPGTLGHPADLDVEVRLVRTSCWSDAIARYSLFGGQGTMNVNSWSPDSRRFAFMAYPIDAA